MRYLFEHLPEDLRVDQSECRRNARFQGFGGLALFAGGTYAMRQMVVWLCNAVFCAEIDECVGIDVAHVALERRLCVQ